MNDPQSFLNILPDVTKSMGLDDKASELALFDVWQTVVQNKAPQYAKYTQASRVQTITTPQGQNKVKLLVSVSDSMAASGLQFLCQELCLTMNQYSQETGIKLDSIELRVKGF